MKKVIHIHIDLFDVSVIIFIDTGFDYLYKWLSKKISNKKLLSEKWQAQIKDGIERNNKAFMFEACENSADVLIYLKERPVTNTQFGFLYHEIYHGIDHIANIRDAGCKLYDQEGHSETRAYLMQYITTKAQHELWKPLPSKKNKK